MHPPLALPPVPVLTPLLALLLAVGLIGCAGSDQPGPRGGAGGQAPDPEPDAAAGGRRGDAAGDVGATLDAAAAVAVDAAPVAVADTAGAGDRAMAVPDGGPDLPAPDVAAPAPDAGGSVEQTPPQGKRAADAWLAAGHYKSWKCEPMRMSPRPLGVHGPNRVCSNALLAGHTGPGPYPVGAASVKEIFYGNRVGNYALAVKIKEGTAGNTWYWYEPGDLEGVGAPGCVGCHNRAPQQGGRDFVFIQVK